MSKNQVETYLCFIYKSNIVKQICKLIINKKGDIYFTLPYIIHRGPTFLVDMNFKWDSVYGNQSHYISYNDIYIEDVSLTDRIFKLTYHPSGFAQFSGTGQISSGISSNGIPKGFSVQSLPFIKICHGPFVGYHFQGDVNLFQKASFKQGKQYTILPIVTGNGNLFKEIDIIYDQNILGVEFFLRKIDNISLMKDYFIIEPNKKDITGIFPHPKEKYFKSRAFFFEAQQQTYALLTRILVSKKGISNNHYINSELTYSFGPATEFLGDNFGKTIKCFHGQYWKDYFNNKISKEINLKNTNSYPPLTITLLILNILKKIIKNQ